MKIKIEYTARARGEIVNIVITPDDNYNNRNENNNIHGAIPVKMFICCNKQE